MERQLKLQVERLVAELSAPGHDPQPVRTFAHLLGVLVILGAGLLRPRRSDLTEEQEAFLRRGFRGWGLVWFAVGFAVFLPLVISEAVPRALRIAVFVAVMVAATMWELSDAKADVVKEHSRGLQLKACLRSVGGVFIGIYIFLAP